MKHRGPAQRWRQPFFTTVLLLLIGCSAYLVLHKMHRLHDQLVQSDAAEDVLNTGRNIAVELARYIRTHPQDDPRHSWARFAQMIRTFGSIENQLQFVALEREDAMVFQAHTRPLHGERHEPDDAISPDLVLPERQMLHMGTGTVPVLTFTLPFDDAEGVAHTLRVGVRKEAFRQREQTAARVIRALLRLTTLTIFISFGAALVAILWLDARDGVRAKQRRAEEHLAYAGVLASGIAHDFRNPMSSLQLDVQMLRREAGKGADMSCARVAQLSERICNISARMEKVFQEFLFLSRPASADRARMALGDLLSDCMQVAQPRLDAAGVRLECHLPAEPVIIEGYVEALRRALLNLLINAEQHAGDNGCILVRLISLRRMARVEVANTGRAISKADRKRIFELFYTTRPEGTGLGLFLARAAIEQNGGRLRLARLEGYATCFRVELPLAPACKDGHPDGGDTEKPPKNTRTDSMGETRHGNHSHLDCRG